MSSISFYTSSASSQETYRKVLIIDDSLSMGHSIAIESYNTRWDYLNEIASLIIKANNNTTTEGCDIWPLNGCRVQNVTSMQNLRHLIPSGGTPLVSTLEKVFTTYESSLRKKPLLITILLDGADDNFSIPPTKNSGEHTFSKWLNKNVVENELLFENTEINFIMCTSEKKVLDYYIDQVAQIKNKNGIEAKIHVLFETSLKKTTENTSPSCPHWRNNLQVLANSMQKKETTQKQEQTVIKKQKNESTKPTSYSCNLQNTTLAIILVVAAVFVFYPKLAIELAEKNRP